MLRLRYNASRNGKGTVMVITQDHGGAFAAALRVAISERRITLSRLQMQLKDQGNPISLATLSYWRSGARQPEGVQSLAVVEGLEDHLGLARGHLTALLGPSTRLGPIPMPRIPFDEDREKREVEEVFTELGAAPLDAIRDLSTHVTAFVGRDGLVDHVVSRSLVQATKGTVTDIPFIDVTQTETDLLTEVSVSGGRVSREYLHPGHRVSGFVVTLDQQLITGATTLLEVTETYPPGHPSRQAVWHAVARAARETLIWVKFTPGALPSWCEEYTETEEDYVLMPRSVASGSVHVVRHGFGPGVLGLRWGYDE